MFASTIFRESTSGCFIRGTTLLSVGITEYVHLSVFMDGYERPGKLEGNGFIVLSFLDEVACCGKFT